MKLTLPKGTTGFFNERNEWVCTGSQMGRPNRIPGDRSIAVKMRLNRLRFVDGDYDYAGAYWGSPANVYWAQSSDVVAFGDSPHCVELFIRAESHIAAKLKVLTELPNARFYR